MTKLQAIRDFTSFVCEDKVVFIRKRLDENNWAMSVADKNPRLQLPADISVPMDEGDCAFRKNFVKRCPLAQGFSHITLTLLHECGHWMTRSAMDIVEYDRMVEQSGEDCEEYFNIPWEHLATDWAICWLYSPANRKVAKAFEKEYFGHA